MSVNGPTDRNRVATSVPAAELRSVVKRFRGVPAVAGLDLRVERGETLGLLGPNGAGKSTTMQLLSGTLRPDSGEVRLFDEGPPTTISLRRRLGVAPQQLALYGELSAEENLRFFGRVAGLVGETLQRAVERALEIAALESRRRDLVRTYSGGMARRLNLAVAVLHEPELLLLDEPTVGVDPQSRAHLLRAIKELRRAGTTVLYCTHYMEEAEALCDRVAIVDAGRVLALGTLAELLRAHGGPSTVSGVVANTVALPEGAQRTEVRGDSVCFDWEVDEPLQALAALAGRGVSIAQLVVRPPNLERAFLRLTGRALRD